MKISLELQAKHILQRSLNKGKNIYYKLKIFAINKPNTLV